MTPTEKILELMRQANITAAQITKELQLNHSAIDNWKSGKAKPSADALSKFADYFNVSVDYLLGRKNNDSSILHFYERLEKLCAEHGTTPTALCKKITNSTGNLATWKNGNARNDHLLKIANEFGVSVDYLLGNDHNSNIRANNIYEKIKKLCEKNNISIYKLEKDCQLSNGSIMKWANSSPNVDTLKRVAYRLNTTLDALITDDIPLNASVAYSEKEMYTFPVIGAICAGYDGTNEFNETGEEITVPKHLLKTHNPKDYFVLEVKGNSMYPLYMPGDKVLIRATTSIDSGSIAAVGYDGEEATLKKVEYEPNKNWMRLIPRNPEYPTVTIRGADLEQCRIYGEVVYLFRDKVGF